MKESTVWRGGTAVLQATWLTWLQARSFFFLLAFGWMVPPLIYLAVWAMAAGEGEVAGLNRGQFVTYYLVLIIVNQLTYAQTNWTLGDLIRGGYLNVLLLRPLHPVWDTIANEIAGKGVFLLFVAPVTAVLALLLRPEWTPVMVNVLAFVPALALAWLLRFLWGYWLALLAFWTTDFSAMLAVQDALIFLLAGQVAPVAVLPPALQTLAVVLPFRYMLGFPVEVLTNQLDSAALSFGLVMQAAWTGITAVLALALWRRGVRRYEAVGG